MKPADKKILFLARWYPDRYDPMPGLFIKRHAEAAGSFVSTAVLYLRAISDNSSVFQLDQTTENGVFTVRVYYGTNFSLPAYFSTLLSAIQFIKAIIKGYKLIVRQWGKPTLIHVNVLTRMGIPALWLKLFYGIDYVITEHWSRYLPVTGSYAGFFRKLTTKVVVKQARAVSTVSENLANAMKAHGLRNQNYLLLPNLVDTEVFKPKDQIANEKKRFIHISCFEDRSKNISALLQVLNRLSRKRNDFECLMVGEGIDLQAMKRLASDLNLTSENVIFTGLLEGESLIKSFQSSLFMVMFSNYENMPVVISESFACGLPVIATKVGGIPEVVNDSNGILVKPHDEDALLKAIDYMLDHHQQFDSGKIREQAISFFGKAAVAKKLKELYSI
ncbi:MAG TPA: glycosyltransferase [Lentimicrobium sp.]|nr:glycosyltransferase [Lentimicrobium sp.]